MTTLEELHQYCDRFSAFSTGKSIMIADKNGVRMPFTLDRILMLARMSPVSEHESLLEVFRAVEELPEAEIEDFILDLCKRWMEEYYTIEFVPRNTFSLN
jgi:hypothetical protein